MYNIVFLDFPFKNVPIICNFPTKLKLCTVFMCTLVLRNFDSAIFFIATKTIKKIYKLEKKMLSQLVLN